MALLVQLLSGVAKVAALVWLFPQRGVISPWLKAGIALAVGGFVGLCLPPVDSLERFLAEVGGGALLGLLCLACEGALLWAGMWAEEVSQLPFWRELFWLFGLHLFLQAGTLATFVELLVTPVVLWESWQEVVATYVWMLGTGALSASLPVAGLLLLGKSLSALLERSGLQGAHGPWEVALAFVALGILPYSLTHVCWIWRSYFG